MITAIYFQVGTKGAQEFGLAVGNTMTVTDISHPIEVVAIRL